MDLHHVHVFAAGRPRSWPFAAHVQSVKLPTIGFLRTATPSGWSQFVATFVQRLRDLGWIDHRAADMF